MVELNINDKPGLQESLRRRAVRFDAQSVSIWKVIATIAGVVAALIGWFGAPASSAMASDYTALRDRVTRLEEQRVADKADRDRQRLEDQEWHKRVDEKLDRLAEGLARLAR